MAHKLLLADDSVTIQRVIELTFADEDVQVVAVGDGQQAIDRLPSERPDIVLADIGMPERDGYEVAAFIRNSPEFSHIPVLLLTGAFEPIDEGRAREVGCEGVLVKPFEPQMVISRVKELLSGKRTPKPAPDAGAASAPASPDTMRAAAASPRASASAGDRAADGGGSIEAYFDRLDAAFGSMDGQSTAPAVSPTDKTQPIPIPVPAPSLSDELANWDPDLSGTPASRTETVLSLDDLKDEPTPAVASDASTPGQAPQTFSFTAAKPVDASPSAAPAAEAPRSIGFATAAPAATAAIASASPSLTNAASQTTSPSTSAPPATSGPAQAPSLAQAFAALLAAERGHTAPMPASQQVSEDVIDQVARRVIEKLGDRNVRDIVLEVAERLVREEIERIKSSAR